MGASTAGGSAITSKANPPELPLGGDRLLHIVRPRTRCERDEFLARGANEKPRALVRAWGRYQPPAAGLSRRPETLGFAPRRRRRLDRKSTRLNSSHVATSYAVFCLKKKSARPDGQI